MPSDITVSDNQLEISRHFADPRDVVFAAYTDANQVEKWWGCNDTVSVKAEIDLRTGGAFRYVMQLSHGMEMVIEGTYVEVVPGEKLVARMTMGPGTEFELEATTTTEFIEQDGGTLLKSVQVGLPQFPGACDIVAEGNNASMEKLEKHLASL